MIQVNLLPDVKLAYVKAERSRRLVLSVCVLITIASLGLLILLLSISTLQKKHMNDLTKDIASESSELQHKPQINKILTVQNQLGRLTELHDSEPATSSILGYLNQVTPANVNINDFIVDFTKQSETITGTADSLGSVNKYIDTLKHTTFTTSQDSNSQAAFKDVLLSSFSISDSAQDPKQAANYTITLTYDPTIFDATEEVTLNVPNIVTTRSDVQQPADLFSPSPTKPKGSN